jgi:hypothetical protein
MDQTEIRLIPPDTLGDSLRDPLALIAKGAVCEFANKIGYLAIRSPEQHEILIRYDSLKAG